MRIDSVTNAKDHLSSNSFLTKYLSIVFLQKEKESSGSFTQLPIFPKLHLKIFLYSNYLLLDLSTYMYYHIKRKYPDSSLRAKSINTWYTFTTGLI